MLNVEWWAAGGAVGCGAERERVSGASGPDERDRQFIQHSTFNIHNFFFRLLMNR